MSLIAVIVDHRPDFVPESGADSCLTLPVFDQVWLNRLCGNLSAAGASEVRIVPASTRNLQNLRRLRSLMPGIQFLRDEQVGSFASTCEPADRLLFYDARYFPLVPLRLESLLVSDGAMPQHLVLMGTAGVREWIILDGRDRIRRVQRLYEGRTHLQMRGVVCSLVTAADISRTCCRVSFVPAGLRSMLVSQEIPGRDTACLAEFCNLCSRDEYLEHASHIIEEHAPRRIAGDRRREDNIRIAGDCDIHPAARLIGPLVIHRGVRIDANAVVIGPAILGTDVHIQREAVVVNSILLPQSRVAAGQSISNCIQCGDSAIAAEPSLISRPQPASPAVPACGASVGGRWYPVLKRMMDCLLTVSGLILIAPLLLVVAGLIKFTSPGRILYEQEREGRGGRSFRCMKFRTMHEGAHNQQRALYKINQVDGPQFKIDADPRITGIGKYLRMLNIDELPQLFNVLRGEMSLVGPRPSPFRENQICIPWRNARLSVIPGITGLWQICRNNRDSSDFHQWISYDLLYVRNASLMLDLKILIATILTFGGRWSVPVEWLIPSDRLNDTPRFEQSRPDFSVAKLFLRGEVERSRQLAAGA